MAGNFNNHMTQVLGRNLQPTVGFKVNKKANVLTAQFGEGYSQRTTTNLNTRNEEYQLSFTDQDINTSNILQEFIGSAGTVTYTGTYPNAILLVPGDISQQGVTYFLWTPPFGTTPIKVVCDELNIEYSSNISRSLNCTFKKVFDL